jgi:hypothetical protein
MTVMVEAAEKFAAHIKALHEWLDQNPPSDCDAWQGAFIRAMEQHDDAVDELHNVVMNVEVPEPCTGNCAESCH